MVKDYAVVGGWVEWMSDGWRMVHTQGAHFFPMQNWQGRARPSPLLYPCCP